MGDQKTAVGSSGSNIQWKHLLRVFSKTPCICDFQFLVLCMVWCSVGRLCVLLISCLRFRFLSSTQRAFLFSWNYIESILHYAFIWFPVTRSYYQCLGRLMWVYLSTSFLCSNFKYRQPLTYKQLTSGDPYLQLVLPWMLGSNSSHLPLQNYSVIFNQNTWEITILLITGIFFACLLGAKLSSVLWDLFFLFSFCIKCLCISIRFK